jgi:hypothetical protein
MTRILRLSESKEECDDKILELRTFLSNPPSHLHEILTELSTLLQDVAVQHTDHTKQCTKQQPHINYARNF